jgi:hypothetical protein
MKQLELTLEEHEVLVPALERELSDLRDEISHTDNGGFKDMLKHRRIILGGVLSKVRDLVTEQEPVA